MGTSSKAVEVINHHPSGNFNHCNFARQDKLPKNMAAKTEHKGLKFSPAIIETITLLLSTYLHGISTVFCDR